MFADFANYEKSTLGAPVKAGPGSPLSMSNITFILDPSMNDSYVVEADARFEIDGQRSPVGAIGERLEVACEPYPSDFDQHLEVTAVRMEGCEMHGYPSAVPMLSFLQDGKDDDVHWYADKPYMGCRLQWDTDANGDCLYPKYSTCELFRPLALDEVPENVTFRSMDEPWISVSQQVCDSAPLSLSKTNILSILA